MLASSLLVHAQALTFNTLAGSAGPGSSDGAGATARFANPWGVAVDTSGNLYVADTDNHTIRMVTPGGVVTTLAGQAGISGSADGTGTNALFNRPQGIAVDGLSNVYVADTGNYTIRKITPGGVVTTLAGYPGLAGSNNATGTNALFYEPEGIAVNSAGTLIYVADTWNHTIRQITAAAAVSTLAGSAGNPGSGNGTGSGAQFYEPQGVAVDSSGSIYVGDTGNQTIRKVTSLGVVSTLAGTAGNYGSTNATGTNAAFWGPQGVAVDTAGNVYVADSLNHTIREVTSAGAVTTLAGTPGSLGSADGTGVAARFWLPQSVAVDPSNNVYVADSANNTIREVTPAAVVTTLAGSASLGSTDGPGSSARFSWPSGAAVDSATNTYVADTGNGTVRKITASGSVSTLAGLAGSFGSADGNSNNARFYAPQGVAVDTSGNLYVADTANHTIRKVTPGGSVSTLAGSAGVSGPSDGTGSTATFNSPGDVAVDASGNAYVADTWNHTIRKVTAAGVVTTLAGLPGYYGDSDGTSLGGGTNTARFYCPSGVAVDSSGNVYVADTRNHAIRKVTPAGAVSTLAGQPGVWGSADGTNSDARFNRPRGIVVDATGSLYVLDSGNHTVRKLTLLGADWAVTTVAGVPDVSGSTDGTGSGARFFYPAGLGVNNVGCFSVADLGNNAIRAVNASLNTRPMIQGQPQDQTVSEGQDATFSVDASGAAPLAYQWRFYGTNLAGATASTYTSQAAQPTDAGPYSVVISNNLGAITSATAQLTVVVPPTITGPPQDSTVNQGQNASFTVAASGTAPFGYQWLYNGDNIAAATDSSYTRTNVQPGDAGTYSVVVSNSAGSTDSPPAVLTVNAQPIAPSIGDPPQSETVAQGSFANFSVTADGSAPFSYQWRLYGTNLAGATAASYTILNAQPAKAGPYSVLVTNDYGAITSATAQLTVILPPIINSQPASQLSFISNTVSFNVGLSQGDNPAYQWRQNGSPIAGATGSSLTLGPLLWSNAGTYSVVVTNLAGSQTSAGATLVVQQALLTFFDGFESYSLGALDNNYGGPNAAPSNPWWALSAAGQSTVTNSSTGVTPHGGAHMAGRTGTSFLQNYVNLEYRLNSGQPYYGNFMCEWWFYDPYGSGTGATSFADYMALASYAPVSATSDYETQTFSDYFQRMSLGAYNQSGYDVAYYQARIIGGAGSFGSGSSWYNTATPRTVGWHHARIIVGIPNASNLAPVFMYIDNMTNAAVFSPTSGTNTGFNLIEMNHANSSSGYYDDLTFRAADDPWIIEQPLSQTVPVGQPAYFNIVAVGTSYQWQFNGTNLAGATTSTYGVAAVAATNAGSYACLISGTNGTIATTAAMLTISGLPAQPGQFVSLDLLTNRSLVLNMSGTPYTNYVLEYTTNWANWTPLGTLSGTNGQFQYIDPSPETNANRFYRLRVGP